MGWKLYFDFCFNMVGGRFIFLCNYDSKLLRFKVPKFYLETIKAWEELEGCRKNFEERIIQLFLTMIFDQDLFECNNLSSRFFAENSMRSISHFQHLGLRKLLMYGILGKLF